MEGGSAPPEPVKHRERPGEGGRGGEGDPLCLSLMAFMTAAAAAALGKRGAELRLRGRLTPFAFGVIVALKHFDS